MDNKWRCGTCGAIVYSMEVHTCYLPFSPVRYYPPSQIFPIQYFPSGQKCEMCGSTAIDHTEIQCQLNRQVLRPVKLGDKEK